MVLGIMHHVLNKLKEVFPEITSVVYRYYNHILLNGVITDCYITSLMITSRLDNAGCYHSTGTVAACKVLGRPGSQRSSVYINKEGMHTP